MSVAVVLLAAGRSTRFGAADKLTIDLQGLPLAHHAIRALTPLPLALRFVVAGPVARNWPGFERVLNDRPETGMSHSIAIGVAAARSAGADAVLIALADMPFVTTEHFQRLLAGRRGPGSIVASSDGTRRMPPALFGADWFAELEQLSGDQGARALLDRAELVTTTSKTLLDVDRPEDLAVAQALLDG
jgi:molybdenum cofactor cytidylyltransferase